MSSKIVVFKEKHGNRYFDVEASGGWSRVCMAMFLERDREGYYYQESPTPMKPRPPADLGDATLVTAYAVALQQYARQEKRKKPQKGWDLLLKARQGDMWAATDVIEGRIGYEYEGYEFLDLEVVPPETPKPLMNPELAELALVTCINRLLADGGTPESNALAAGIRDDLLLSHVNSESPGAPVSRKKEREIRGLWLRLDRLLRDPGSIRAEVYIYRDMVRFGHSVGRGPLPRYLQQYGSVEAAVDAYMKASPAINEMGESEIQRDRESIRALFQEQP